MVYDLLCIDRVEGDSYDCAPGSATIEQTRARNFLERIAQSCREHPRPLLRDFHANV
jgi:hypothetical protein